jgi:hypothetical protein
MRLFIYLYSIIKKKYDYVDMITQNRKRFFAERIFIERSN